jgi:flavodoxin
MSFTPLKLLIAYDNDRGYCGRVVPRMREMLEHRAFQVESMVIDGSNPDLDLEEFDGLVLGTPASGVSPDGPSQKVQDFIAAIDDLDEVRVALFCVYDFRPGKCLDALSELVLDHGGEVVAGHPYWVLRPARDEHVIPAECMVRIR